MFLKVTGHVLIEDEDKNVLLDKTNAIHPQNMARVIARSLSNEDNHSIYSIAFGNGGTTVDAAFNIIYKTPNDGISPDVRQWDSRLYNEMYREIIDEGTVVEPNELIGEDLGSAGPNVGNRVGGGAVPLDDPASIPNISGPGVRSIEEGLISRVQITSVINPSEPLGSTDDFVFDELGLYTSGAPAIDSSGYQNIGYGDKESTSETGLVPGETYDFNIQVDGTLIPIQLTPPISGGSGSGGEFLYGDLCQALNTGDITWNSLWTPSVSPIGQARVSITDNTTIFSTITGSSTNGFLQFVSGTSGTTSSILISRGTTNDILTALGITDDSGIGTPIVGYNAGVQNDPSSSTNERERLLTHLIFEPITRPIGRQFTIKYSLLVTVARTTS